MDADGQSQVAAVLTVSWRLPTSCGLSAA
jgi:hypothetical protein